MIGLVEAGWRRVLQLPPGAPALAKNWEGAGGDSLATLQLLLYLGQRLGRRFDYALIEPDMTVAEMAAKLAVDHAEPVDVPPVFLLPGQFGDGPGLVRFRNWFGTRWQMRVIDLPALDDNGRLLDDMEATGRFVAAAIARAQPEGAVRLAGYSYGGSVAYEAAHELQAKGREIAFLGILDTAFGAAARAGAPDSGFRGHWRRLARNTMLTLMKPRRIRSLMLSVLTRLPPARALAARNFIARHFRTRARHNWRPRPIIAPALVAVSAEFEVRHLPVWQALLPQAGIVRLPGRHRDIFGGDTLALLATAFETALVAR